MANGDLYRASIISMNLSGTAFVMDFGYVDQTSSVHVDMGIAAGNFETLVQAALLAILPDSVAVLRYRFACVGGPNVGDVGFVEASPGTVGLISGVDVFPGEICISMKRNTGHVERTDRGRVFFGPVCETFRLTGTTDTVDTANTDLVTFSNLLKSNLTVSTATLKPAIVSSAGGYSGNVVINTSIGRIFTHRRSRRLREAI